MTKQTTENLLVSTQTYAGDLEGHLDDLAGRLEGTDEERAMSARDRIRGAITDLERIDGEEVNESP